MLLLGAMKRWDMYNFSIFSKFILKLLTWKILLSLALSSCEVYRNCTEFKKCFWRASSLARGAQKPAWEAGERSTWGCALAIAQTHNLLRYQRDRFLVGILALSRIQ